MNTHKFNIVYPKELPSVNDMYLIGRSKNKVWTYLNPAVAEFKKEVRTALAKQGAVEQFADYDKGKTTMRLEIAFVFSKEFWSRDVDNLVKPVCDAFTQLTKLDDSLNLTVNMRKIFNDIDDKEHIIMAIHTQPMDEAIYKWSSFCG